MLGQKQQPSSLSLKGSVDDILKLAYGGQVGGEEKTDMSGGGNVEGPSHEEGGVPVVQKGTGEQIAEVEGKERIFSKEDTAALEQSAEQIIQMQQSGDKAGAEDMAKRLGFAVVNMIAAQEENQAAQEQQMSQRAPAGAPQPSSADAQAMNEFGPVE